MSIVKNFSEWLNESIRHERTKIPLNSVKYAYHWVNEGNLFEQIYDTTGIDTKPYILRKYDGKKLIMPEVPHKKFVLGGEGMGVCLTVDPGYLSAGYTGESNVCLVFDMQELISNFEIEDLTDNGESEIRIKTIPNFDSLVKKVFIVKKVYEKGDGWEGFYYRAVQEWFPDELKVKTDVLSSQKAIGAVLKRLS